MMDKIMEITVPLKVQRLERGRQGGCDSMA